MNRNGYTAILIGSLGVMAMIALNQASGEAGPAQAPTPQELGAKSGYGYFARMWRTAACEKVVEPQFPSIERNGKGKLLLLLTCRLTNNAPAVLAVARSADEGKTWSDPQQVYSPSEETPRALGTLTHLKDGELIAPFTDGNRVRMLHSQDGGATWSISEPIDCSPLTEATPHGRLVTLKGELLMPLFGKLTGQHKTAPCSGLLRSKDGGKTWGSFTVIACDRAKGKVKYGPTAVQIGPQNEMLALISVGQKSLYRSISQNNGKTWSTPEHRMLAYNPALAQVGPTMACVSQSGIALGGEQRPTWRGAVRVKFSDTRFDSWRCDRMPDWSIHGQHFSALGLDNDRLLFVHDRAVGYRPPSGGTRVTEGIEVTMMQRNPRAPPTPASIIPSEKRDRWALKEKFILPFEGSAGETTPTSNGGPPKPANPLIYSHGAGETTQTHDGRLVLTSDNQIYTSRDQGKTFKMIDRPGGSWGTLGVLRSGRWLLALRDNSGFSHAAWAGRPVQMGRQPDGFDYERITNVKGVLKIKVYYSDDEGAPWQGGQESIDMSPLVWAIAEGRFIETADGAIAMTVYGCLSAEDTAGRIDCCGLLWSKDGGKTWGDFSLIAYDKKGGEIAYNEVDVQPMPDGTWVAVIRTEWRSHSGSEPASMSVCFSKDQGRTWTKPEFAFLGAVPDLVLLPDSGLLCASSFSLLRFSYDGGHTWSLELPAYVNRGEAPFYSNYPAVELLDSEFLFVCGRWNGRHGCIYRRVPARAGQ